MRILGNSGRSKSALEHILVENLKVYEGNIIYNSKDRKLLW